jgi:hypothetical protein
MSMTCVRTTDPRTFMSALGGTAMGRIGMSAALSGRGVAAASARAAEAYKPQHVDARNAALRGADAWSPPV